MRRRRIENGGFWKTDGGDARHHRSVPVAVMTTVRNQILPQCGYGVYALVQDASFNHRGGEGQNFPEGVKQRSVLFRRADCDA